MRTAQHEEEAAALIRREVSRTAGDPVERTGAADSGVRTDQYDRRQRLHKTGYRALRAPAGGSPEARSALPYRSIFCSRMAGCFPAPSRRAANPSSSSNPDRLRGSSGHSGSAIGSELGDTIVFDMGGTTAKASIIVNGEYGIAPETEVGGGASLGHRMIRGGGYVVQAPTHGYRRGRVPAAAALPGSTPAAAFKSARTAQEPRRDPVCYGQGGTEADGHGRKPAVGIPEPGRTGRRRPDPGSSASCGECAIVGHRRSRLDQSVTDAAYGIHLIANARMMRALERGFVGARPGPRSLLRPSPSAATVACMFADWRNRSD